MDDFASNHNGGLLAVRPRRACSTSAPATAASPTTPSATARTSARLLGKILRIDPRGIRRQAVLDPGGQPVRRAARAPGPRSTPTACATRGASASTADTGALAIGDVGQNSLRGDRLRRRPAGRAGANFGWSAFEGTERFNEDQEAPGHVPPVLTYGRDEGCSVTGGYVVRDRELPSLDGRYLYGDFCAGELRSFVPASGGARDDRALGLAVSLAELVRRGRRRAHLRNFARRTGVPACARLAASEAPQPC